MFLLALFSGTILHSYGTDIIPSANERQLQLKVEYCYKVLEMSQIENSSITYLQAIAENLAMGILGSESSLPGDYVRERVQEVMEWICPSGHALELEVTHRGSAWIQRFPENLDNTLPYHEFSGKVTLVLAGVEDEENRVAVANAFLRMYEVR